MELVSRAPGPSLAGLIDDLYYLEGAPPYPLLTLPAAPAPLLILNLGAPFRVRGDADGELVERADGCVVSTPTRAWDFGYPDRTCSVGVHFTPWGLGSFLSTPAADLCDRPTSVEQVWGRPAVDELRDRLRSASRPHEMLTVLEHELERRRCDPAGLDVVRQASTVIVETRGAVKVGELNVATGASGAQLVQRFKAIVGVSPKRLARSYRFTAAVLALDPEGPIDWADVAAGAGYFDQAHFGHEFREFTGFTPTRYVEARRRFRRDHPGHVLDGWPLPAE